MLKFLVSFCVVFAANSARAAEKPFIISGFDDVVRQAENTSLMRAALKILEPDKTFAGMPELYSAIAREEPANNKFALVSAITNMFKGRCESLLSNSNYPQGDVYLRSWLTEWSIESFKLGKIKQIMAAKPDRHFLIIFDNSDASLRMAEKLHADYPDKILAIYLRQVVAQKIPEGATPFYSAFDIALNEFLNNRLNREDLNKVASAILGEKDAEKILPAYASCPARANLCEQAPDEVKDLCLKVISRVCGARRAH